MRTFCDRFKAIQAAHGPHAIAVLSTGQIATEEMALLGCLAKFGMGLRHVDSNTRQCMATAATAYKQSFGFDAPPYTYDDFEQSDVIVLVGSNLCIAHPILWDRICRNPHRPQIVVIDPRKTETAMAATLHLAIQPKSRPGVFLRPGPYPDPRGLDRSRLYRRPYRGLRGVLLARRAVTPDVVALRCGIEESALHWLAMLIHKGKRVSFWWTMGINQSYEGHPRGPKPDQPGPDHREHGTARHRGQFRHRPMQRHGLAAVCQRHQPAGRPRLRKARRPPQDRADPRYRRRPAFPTQNSWAYHEILEGILGGKIRGLWVIGTNPAHSWINQNMLGDVLGRLDFLVVQDMYHDAPRPPAGPICSCRRPPGAKRTAPSSIPSGAAA